MSDNRRILVVEDDPDGQALVSHVLDYLNIAIDVVGDAEQASHCLFDSDTAYRAVIVDLALPGRDGWNLLADIRANRKTANLPCVAITAFHTSKIREQAVHAGFAAYFPKPLDVASFAQELEALI